MKRLLFFLMAFIGVGIMSGQVVDTTGISDPVFPGGAGVDEMVEIYQVVYGALVILFGYVAKFFWLEDQKPIINFYDYCRRYCYCRGFCPVWVW
jgi:hypothetical protein